MALPASLFEPQVGHTLRTHLDSAEHPGCEGMIRDFAGRSIRDAMGAKEGCALKATAERAAGDAETAGGGRNLPACAVAHPKAET